MGVEEFWFMEILNILVCIYYMNKMFAFFFGRVSWLLIPG